MAAGKAVPEKPEESSYGFGEKNVRYEQQSLFEPDFLTAEGKKKPASFTLKMRAGSTFL